VAESTLTLENESTLGLTMRRVSPPVTKGERRGVSPPVLE